MSNFLQYTYDLLTSPSATKEGYEYLPFHGALWVALLLEFSYIAFVFKIGPWLMRNREPCNLTTVLAYYNIIQIVFNFFMGIIGIYLYLYIRVVPLSCMTLLPWDHPLKNVELFSGYLYFINKFLDLFDTICFVLRKSYKQVTFLHVYHHVMMTGLAVIYMRNIGTGGHAAFTATLNSIVHVIMYGYYFVSATRPHMKNSLWWKKYITQMQLVQFVLAFIHNMWPLVIVPECKVPKIFCVFSVIQAVIMVYLFGSFYKKAYLDVRKKVAKSNKVK